MTETDSARALLALHNLGSEGNYTQVAFVLGRLSTPPNSTDLREAMYKALGAWVGEVAEPLPDAAEEQAAALLHTLLESETAVYDSARDIFRVNRPTPTLPQSDVQDIARICALWWMTCWQPPARWHGEEDLSAYVAACTALCTAGEYDLAADVLMTAVDDRTPTVHDQLDLWGAYRTQLQLWQLIVGDATGEQLSDPPTRMLAFMNLGRAHDNLGQYAPARTAYERVVEMARAAGDRRTEGQVLGNLGLVSHSTGDYAQAIRYYEESITAAREVGNRVSEGRQLGNLGNVYWRIGDFHKALAYQQQRLTLAREQNDKRGEGYALSNVAQALSSLGHTANAMLTLRQALDVRRAIGDRAGEATDLANLGWLLYEIGHDTNQAVEYLLLSALIRKEIDSPNFSASLTMLRTIQDEWPGGSGWFSAHVRIWCDKGPTDPHSKATLERGLREIGQGKATALADWLHEAINTT